MLIINKQSLEESVNERRNLIQLNILNEVKDIIASPAFSNDEKTHLIQSCFIVEKAEMAQLDKEVEEIVAGCVIWEKIRGEGKTCGTDCDCENADAPVGQMTIFEFLGPDSEPEEKAAETIKNELPEEIAAVIQEFTSALQTAFGN